MSTTLGLQIARSNLAKLIRRATALAVIFAGYLSISLSISSQFTFKMCIACSRKSQKKH